MALRVSSELSKVPQNDKIGLNQQILWLKMKKWAQEEKTKGIFEGKKNRQCFVWLDDNREKK